MASWIIMAALSLQGFLQRSINMTTKIMSFGFRWALLGSALPEGWLVIDARHIQDPAHTFAGSPLRGTDKEVQDVVLANPAASAMIDTLERTIRWSDSELHIAIGCTSGRHRSVAVAEKLAQRLSRYGDLDVEVIHRDIHK